MRRQTNTSFLSLIQSNVAVAVMSIKNLNADLENFQYIIVLLPSPECLYDQSAD